MQAGAIDDMIFTMKRLIAFLILTLLFTGCSSTRTAKSQNASADEENALRMALSQASDKVPATLFASMTTEQFLTAKAVPLLTQTQVPLITDNLQRYTALCQNAFRTTLLSVHDTVAALSQTIGITDPKALVFQRDDSMSVLLDVSAKTEVTAVIQKKLAGELTEANAVLERIISDYRIWDKGKSKLGMPGLPAVTMPAIEDYTNLFYTTYLSALRTQEIDVRTTPRPEGTGSLYEFFAKEKAGTK